MTLAAFTGLACPLDGAPMLPVTGGWRCPSGHHFDIARDGYIHLLPVQHKRSRDPGDSRTMVAARRRYLEAGHYAPIAAAVCAALLSDAHPDTTLRCLDAGCGEGYYLRQLAETAAGRSIEVIGVDISKWAVQAAARRQPQLTWVVASNARLPVLDAALDRVLCLFGFPHPPEFARVLRPGGEVLLADPGPEHLRELREIIYPTLKAPRSSPAQPPAGFAAMPADDLNLSLNLRSGEAIADLLAMTPHQHRASAEGRAAAAALTHLDLTLDVRLTRWRRL
ncbi:MAG: putative RNA methyltransferase [Gammaproteobacteria bacterium]